MVEPVVLARSEHPISRHTIDPDALRVLYRLRQFNYVAYLVGGSVRDLLLGRRPKDFDIGTTAHPYQIKRLFRNCWIIGRRFRLAHVKFGTKVIEVATFRRQVPAGTEEEPPVDQPVATDTAVGTMADGESSLAHARDRLIHRDNTFGTSEEDAFRRDFTINALFYDIATFSVIDYVGGLEDLNARLIRCIGNPDERFAEDPVRMLRAVALAARLDFRIDDVAYAAIKRHRADIARSAPPRLLEEYYKILRSGCAERTFRSLDEAGLLEHITPELRREAGDDLWRWLAELDTYRARFEATPETLTNPILLGTLLVPLGLHQRPRRSEPAAEPVAERHEARPDRRREPPLALGILPIARGDIERLRQLLVTQRRLLDIHMPPRVKRGLIHRNTFTDALTWLDAHGDAANVVEHWKALRASGTPASSLEEHQELTPSPRRRRRRRRRYHPPVA